MGQWTEKSDAGFVLLLVIVCMGIAALATAVFLRQANVHVRTVSQRVEAARSEAIADAGVNLAILKLYSLNAKKSQLANGSTIWHCFFDNDYLRIEVEDEGGKVDLNFASERLLRALLIGLGAEPGRASSLAATIADFRDLDDDKRPNGAERAEYVAAGRAWGPKNSAFAIVEELNQVLGIDSDLLDRMLPFVTVHSGKDGIDPDVAPSQLVEIIGRGDREPVIGSVADELTFPFFYRGLPGHFVTRSYSSYFTVRSTAVTKAGASFVREVIMDISAANLSISQGYRVWKWRRVATTNAPQMPTFAAPVIPPC